MDVPKIFGQMPMDSANRCVNFDSWGRGVNNATSRLHRYFFFRKTVLHDLDFFELLANLSLGAAKKKSKLYGQYMDQGDAWTPNAPNGTNGIFTYMNAWFLW